MIFLLTPVSDLTFSVVYCVIATTSGRTMSEDCIEWDESVKAQNNWFLEVKMLFWTPHFSVLDSTFFVLDSTFWLDYTLKIDLADDGAIGQVTYDFLLVFYNNFGRVSYRFCATVNFIPKWPCRATVTFKWQWRSIWIPSKMKSPRECAKTYHW